MKTEDRWPPGFGCLMAFAASAFIWGAVAYVVWWVWFQ